MDVRRRTVRRNRSMKRFAIAAGILFFAVLSPRLAAATPPPTTVPSVNLKKYQGQWYNIARLPAWFQNECARSTAHYTLRPDGTVAVRNECWTHAGKKKAITGVAKSIDPKTNARLVVTFDNWAGKLGLAKGDYWILALGPNYDSALVGTPNRKYLWILARQKKLAPAHYSRLVRQAKSLGFDTTRLVKDQW